MVHFKRRAVLKRTLAGGAIALAAGAGLLKPARVFAAEWPKNAFYATNLNEGAVRLYGGALATASKAIGIKAPTQAENGAVVPIIVNTTLPNVESIGIFVEKNTNPLIVTATLNKGAAGYFGIRMKMGATSEVKVYIKADGKLYTASQLINVAVGGCGG